MSQLSIKPIEEDSEGGEQMPAEESSSAIHRDYTTNKVKNALDAFLSATYRPTETAEVYIKSIDATITVRELSEAELSDIMSMSDGSREQVLTKMAAQLVASGLVDPDLNDSATYKKLSEGLQVVKQEEIIRKVFKPLEITAIAEVVLDLSGGADDAVTTAKN